MMKTKIDNKIEIKTTSKITIKEWLRLASQKLSNITPVPQLEAEAILASQLHLSRTELFTRSEDTLSRETLVSLGSLVQRRFVHYPLQYITGKIDFYKNTFQVNDQVLIPRIDTEKLLELCIKELHNILSKHDELGLERNIRILEIGVGSGVIMISLIAEINDWLTLKEIDSRVSFEIVGVDINPAAISLSRENLAKLVPSIANAIKIRLIESDVYAKLVPNKYDLIVSNPPYLREKESLSCQTELGFEPKEALVSEQDGMGVYRKIICNLHNFLHANGRLLLEINPLTLPELTQLTRDCGYVIRGKYNGLQNEDRFVKISSKVH